MGHFLPTVLGRPENLIAVPQVVDELRARRAGFTAGDPRPWIPGTLRRLARRGARPLPWSRECDLLLAPYPAPGEEAAALLDLVSSLPPAYPVALYERDTPLLPNAVVPAPADDGEEAAGGGRARDFRDPAAGLRAWRSALRQRGVGGAEALLMLPARRLRRVLRGSALAVLRPGPGASLENRRLLWCALDHQRTLAALAPAGGGALPAARRVLVVMPHFDDEVLQCGGALLCARDAGAEVRMIWLTDGAGGERGAAPEKARLRHEEARSVMARLGIQDFHFLDAPETLLHRRGPWTRRLARLLRDFEPERVHTVWWADNHVDHYEAARVLRAAWPRRFDDVLLAASGLWTPLPGGALLPLPEELRRRKDELLALHASQLQEVDYLRAERGLACWYGRRLGGGVGAEAFLVLPAPAFFGAFRRSGADRRWFAGRRAAAAERGPTG